MGGSGGQGIGPRTGRLHEKSQAGVGHGGGSVGRGAGANESFQAQSLWTRFGTIFHRSDIFQRGRENVTTTPCRLLICYHWGARTFVLGLNGGGGGGLSGENEGNSLTIYHHYEVQRQPGAVIKSCSSC